MFKRNKNTNKEFISTKQEIKEAAKFTVKDLLGGNMLSKEVVIRQLPFVIFLSTVILLYIFNQYRGENIMRQIMALEKRIREMRSEAVSTAFELQEISRQSEVSRMILEKGLTLQEAKTPPYKIVMDE